MPPTLDVAEVTPLMGLTASWDFHGGKPLGVCPDKVLRHARRWFASKVRETGGSADMRDRMREQIACIDVILFAREATNPQQALAL